MQGFEGKVLVVAGGARGIGAQVARDYAASGGRVAIGDTNHELGTNLAREIGSERAFFAPLDVTKEESCQAFVAAAVDRFGSVDHLVNSAISIQAGKLLDVPLAAWQTTIDVGLTGT